MQWLCDEIISATIWNPTGMVAMFQGLHTMSGIFIIKEVFDFENNLGFEKKYLWISCYRKICNF